MIHIYHDAYHSSRVNNFITNTKLRQQYDCISFDHNVTEQTNHSYI